MIAGAVDFSSYLKIIILNTIHVLHLAFEFLFSRYYVMFYVSSEYQNYWCQKQ
jgi:hypothetical protein